MPVLAWGLAAGIGQAADVGTLSSTAAADLKTLTGDATRVVWCQDIGKGTDTMAEGSELCLMGLDTEDGRGERVILATPANYAKPTFTPKGDRIVYSNRRESKMYVVNWDGAGQHTLGDGFALDTWLDPATGIEWVYYGVDPVEHRGTSFKTIRRRQIDHPEIMEPIWSRTIVSQDFEVSADGWRSASAFPWPDCGLAELPNESWKAFGKGCWPALAPDNSYRLWIFDGAHRNLTLIDTDTGERWSVPINTAPGTAGYEVYHPRWSNHPRFMSMSGPYKIGEGQNRLGGGGPEVEIYVGRFSPDFKTIESWCRVTRNQRPDFYPDVWVASGSKVCAESVHRRLAHPATDSTAWPADTAGLVFLWENRSKNNEIQDGAATRVCRVEPRGAARYGRFFEMDLRAGGAFVAESGAAELLAACASRRQLTVSLVVTPAKTNRSGLANIIAFASQPSSWNFIVGQDSGQLTFRLRTERGADPNDEATFKLCALTNGIPHQVIVVYSGGALTGYLNGSPVFFTNGVLAGRWSPQPLVFGQDGAGNGQWRGNLEGAALYARALSPDEVKQDAARYASRLRNRTPAKQLVVEARLAESAAIPTPAAISPYRRALALNRYDVEKVLQGTCAEKQLLAAHWAILDAKVLDNARREKSRVYRMTLEAFDDHPELEGERLLMESDEFLLPRYYIVSEQ